MTIGHSAETLGLVESANSVALTMFGYSKSGIVGKDINMLIPPPFSAVHNKYLTAFLETGVTVRRSELRDIFAISISMAPRCRVLVLWLATMNLKLHVIHSAVLSQCPT